jgi:phage recombination protein Bet
MTTAGTVAMATVNHSSPLISLGQRFNIEPNKLMEVLRGTVIKPDRNNKQATNEEVAAFCIVAQQYGLNPFTREIHAFASGDKGVVPIVGIDGWTHIVNACAGFNGCEFDEQEDKDGKPVSVTCRMFVKGREHPVSATERFKECYRNTIPWNTMPFRMLRHKAYIQAARYAFGLSGIFDEDEARDIVSGKNDRAPIAMPQAINITEVKPVEPEPQKPEHQPEPPKEQPKPQAPAKPTPEGEVVEGVVEEVSIKDGEKNGKKWTKFGIKINGDFYGTFDSDLGNDAGELEGANVRLTWKQDGKYRTALAIEAVADQPATDTQGNTDSVPREQEEDLPFNK